MQVWQTDRRENRQAIAENDRKADKTDREENKDGQTDRQSFRQTVLQTDRQTDGQTGKKGKRTLQLIWALVILVNLPATERTCLFQVFTSHLTPTMTFFTSSFYSEKKWFTLLHFRCIVTFIFLPYNVKPKSDLHLIYNVGALKKRLRMIVSLGEENRRGC